MILRNNFTIIWAAIYSPPKNSQLIIMINLNH